jgi:hypothetical protein
MILSTGTISGKKYHTAGADHIFWSNEDMHYFPAMINWCNETFGPRENDGWIIPIGLPRWTIQDAKFWFRDERDFALFLLRWA